MKSRPDQEQDKEKHEKGYRSFHPYHHSLRLRFRSRTDANNCTAVPRRVYCIPAMDAIATPFRFPSGGTATMINTALIAALVGGLAALAYAIRKSIWIHRRPVGIETLERIAGYIADGAQAFLKREYTVLVPFVLVVAIFLAVANTGALRLQAVSFLLGALCSAAAGYFGMKTATAANSRTAIGAMESLETALKVAFTGGSVMGMTVVGLALLGLIAVMAGGILTFRQQPACLA
jgi:hypothetical protein